MNLHSIEICSTSSQETTIQGRSTDQSFQALRGSNVRVCRSVHNFLGKNAGCRWSLKRSLTVCFGFFASLYPPHAHINKLNKRRAHTPSRGFSPQWTQRFLSAVQRRDNPKSLTKHRPLIFTRICTHYKLTRIALRAHTHISRS